MRTKERATMKNYLATFALTLFFFNSHAVAKDTWIVKEAPPGLGAKWIAEVKNTSGDTLRVYRKIGRSGYEAFAELTLAEGKQFSNQMPLYQIDNGKLEDSAVIKRAGDVLNRNWATLKSNQASWRIWTSTDKTISPSSELTPWLKGNNLIIKYTTSSKQKEKTAFSLKGSSKSIKMAISGAFQ